MLFSLLLSESCPTISFLFRYCLILLVALFLPGSSIAQVNSGEEVPQVTRTYALENAHVVQAPGRAMERATVIIRDGLITMVAPDATIPFDAERIEADSLTVYAGFIDGLSHAGIPKPKEEQDEERPDNPGNPPDADAGIQPDRDVRTMLDPEEKSLENHRKAGFTAAHVVPYGRMLPGSGAIILLAGDTANDLVFKGDVSLFAQFETARRMYPGTDMAIIAKMHQLYREAQRRQHIETLYAENPTGMERPAYDPTHYALFPVLNGEKAVYFHTEDALDLQRVLTVQEALDFPVVLTGLSQSYDTIEKLQDAGHPLLLTLDLPTLPKKEEHSEESLADSTAIQPSDVPAELPEISANEYDPAFRTRSLADLEAEKKNLEARRDQEHKKYFGNAGTLHDAGLSFGFTTMGAKPADVMDNIRAMIENGLPEDAALAALTTNPASILGVSSSMGTVDAGKMGNLVVTTGPAFHEDTKIRYVFVDGEKFEIETKNKPATTGQGAVNPAGNWSYEVETPDGESIAGMLTIAGSPNDLSGTITSDFISGDIELDDMTLDAGVLSFSFYLDDTGTITMSVTLSENDFEGSVMTADTSMAITGTRMSDPE